MDALKRIIGKEVTARIPKEEIGEFNYLKGRVIHINVNDFYFYEKNEPIYVTVDLQPRTNDKLNLNEEELDMYNNIPLEYITLH